MINNTHIKCTVEEDAPLYESYIYITDNNPESNSILNQNKTQSSKIIEQIVDNLLIERGLKIKKVEQLPDPLYSLDLDATRTDDLPYIILNIKDLDFTLQQKAG